MPFSNNRHSAKRAHAHRSVRPYQPVRCGCYFLSSSLTSSNSASTAPSPAAFAVSVGSAAVRAGGMASAYIFCASAPDASVNASIFFSIVVFVVALDRVFERLRRRLDFLSPRRSPCRPHPSRPCARRGSSRRPGCAASPSLRTCWSSSECASASRTIFSISASDRPLDALMMIDCSLPVALSFADTFRMPFASMSKLTSTCGMPRGAGGMSARSKRPSDLFCDACLRSPCST